MWKKILVGFDGSEHSKKALKKAEKIATQNQSHLIIVNVYRELVTRQFSIEMLEKAKKTISDTVSAEITSSRNTNVDNELVEIAEKNGVDLIIVGSRGMGEAASLLLGSVSHEVAINAPVDVLIVRN